MSYVDMAVGRVAGEKKALASDRGLTALDALVSGIWYLVYCTGPIAYPIVNGYSPSGTWGPRTPHDSVVRGAAPAGAVDVRTRLVVVAETVIGGSLSTT